MSDATIIIDAMGKQCPVPVVMAKKKIDALQEPSVVEVHVDNRTAVENLTRLGESYGADVTSTDVKDGEYAVSIDIEKVPEKSAQNASQALVEDISKAVGGKRTTVAVFSSKTMGNGSDELGAILIKGFIYALSQMDSLPDTCLFYNGGAFLTTEGSESLADLKAMEEAGVEILTCGTCADFYGIKDKVAVGGITNMYTIAEKMTQADKIIKPC